MIDSDTKPYFISLRFSKLQFSSHQSNSHVTLTLSNVISIFNQFHWVYVHHESIELVIVYHVFFFKIFDSNQSMLIFLSTRKWLNEYIVNLVAFRWKICNQMDFQTDCCFYMLRYLKTIDYSSWSVVGWKHFILIHKNQTDYVWTNWTTDTILFIRCILHHTHTHKQTQIN